MRGRDLKYLVSKRRPPGETGSGVTIRGGLPGGGQRDPLQIGGGGGQCDPLQPGGGGGVTMVGSAVLGPVVQGGRPRTPHDGDGGAVFLGAVSLLPVAGGRLGPVTLPGPNRRLNRARASGLARPNWICTTRSEAGRVPAAGSGAAPAVRVHSANALTTKSTPATAAMARRPRMFSKRSNGSMALNPYQATRS